MGDEYDPYAYFRMPDDPMPRVDEFTLDAAQFGIEVPSGYGHVTNCNACRDFRNEVREARAKWDQYLSDVDARINTAMRLVWTPEPVSVPTWYEGMDAATRITCAINLANTEWPSGYLAEKAKDLISALLS